MKRHRRSPGAITVTVTVADSQDRRARIVADYTPATEAYFSQSFGNYLPGDSEDLEVVEVKAIDHGADIAELLREMTAIENAVRQEAGSVVDDAAAEAAERSADLARDDYLERRTP